MEMELDIALCGLQKKECRFENCFHERIGGMNRGGMSVMKTRMYITEVQYPGTRRHQKGSGARPTQRTAQQTDWQHFGLLTLSSEKTGLDPSDAPILYTYAGRWSLIISE